MALGRPNKSDKRATLRPGAPKKPGLGAAASREWDRLVSELQQANIPLTTAHAGLLAVAAGLAADMADCDAELHANGSNYVDVKGEVKLHPAARRLDYLRRDYAKIINTLGATKPVQEDEDPEPSDPMAKLLKGKQ